MKHPHPTVNAFYQALDRTLFDLPSEAMDASDRYLQEVARSHAKYAGRPERTTYYPYVLSLPQWTYIARVMEGLSGLIEKAIDLFLTQREVRSLYRLEPGHGALIEKDPGYSANAPLSRWDSFFGEGGLKFTEVNTDGAAWMEPPEVLAELYASSPFLEPLLETRILWRPQIKEAVLAGLLRAYREFGGGKARPNIAIVDWEGVKTGEEFVAFQELFERKGHKTYIADPRALDYDGRRLTFRGSEVDLVYRRVVGVEFARRLDEVKALSRAYLDGNICLVGPFRSDVGWIKTVFVLLSDPRFSGYFTEEERRLIGEHIPWTSPLTEAFREYQGKRIDLLPFVADHKDLFVIKPAAGYGGLGVRIGMEETEEDWRANLSGCADENYLVQEYIEPPLMDCCLFDDAPSMRPLQIHLGQFVFGGRLSGLLCRALESGVIDDTSKEMTLPSFVHW